MYKKSQKKCDGHIYAMLARPFIEKCGFCIWLKNSSNPAN
jgi:hypothetical protein